MYEGIQIGSHVADITFTYGEVIIALLVLPAIGWWMRGMRS